MNQYNLDEQVENTNGELPIAPRLPKGVYTLRVKEEPEAKVSKAGNNMLVFKLEVVAPATAFIKDKNGDRVEYQVAGKDATVWATFTDRGNPTLRRIHIAAGFPNQFSVHEETGAPLDVTGAPLRYTGVEFPALCDSREEEQRDEDGKPIINPTTGAVVKFYNTQVREIFVAESTPAA